MRVDRINGGAERARTADLCVANAALSQLSYGPTKLEFGLPLELGETARSTNPYIEAIGWYRLSLARGSAGEARR